MLCQESNCTQGVYIYTFRLLLKTFLLGHWGAHQRRFPLTGHYTNENTVTGIDISDLTSR